MGKLIEFAPALRKKYGIPDPLKQELIEIKVRDPDTGEIVAWECTEPEAEKLHKIIGGKLREIYRARYVADQIERGKCISYFGCNRDAEPGPRHLCTKHRRREDRENRQRGRK